MHLYDVNKSILVGSCMRTTINVILFFFNSAYNIQFYFFNK